MTKQCPKCGQSFADQNLNFCLNDGELLMYADDRSAPQFSDEPPPTKFAGDDSPPTLMMKDPRVTDPIGWAGTSSPPVQYQGQQIVTPPGHQPVQYANYAGYTSPNQVMGILSLIMGLSSITVGWCCYTGMLLGPAAIILGVITLIQHKGDPMRYGGKGLGIAGIILGGLYLVGIILFILLYGLANFLSMASYQ